MVTMVLLLVYWYDLICFGIVGVTVAGSLYVIWRREGGGNADDTSMYERLLLLAPPEKDGYGEDGVTVTPRVRNGNVSSSQLWTSCWRGLHPIWLLGLRFVSCAVMAGFLAWDILEYDASIFVYYTEWTFTTVTAYFAIGTIVSAHGCMVYYSKKPPPDNGEKENFLKRDMEESISTNALNFRAKDVWGSIKLQSHYDQEAIRQRAGFWGYLMQTAYQHQTC